ncbi:F-box/LRR-repeat protein 3 [Apostasia shenzhenica]|uniref:F-box/LRR-repeat protein 3 n=1 Tax=Apostasia shenzhenica TaxID=1088818 RepID=A0A2I0BAM3_9ASPA|nr:F-box/LRR-repeat protein 3 [Apostasia shenzhenica]
MGEVVSCHNEIIGVATVPTSDARCLKSLRFSENSKLNPFDALSEEILFLILDHLQSNAPAKKSFSHVCRSFYAVESRHRQAIRFFRSDLISAVISRYPFVSRVDLSLCTRVSDGALASIAGKLGPSLISIDLSRSRYFSHLGLNSLATSCASLVEINLSGAFDLDDPAAAAIGRLKNLERLWLTRCKLVTDMGLGCIAVGCRKLKLLCLKWCLGLTDLGVGLVAVKCKEIRSLDLSYTMVTKKCLPGILRLPTLEELSLVGCPGIDDEGLATLKEGCKSLQVLDMSNCQHVSDAGLSSIINGAFSMRQLILAYHSPVSYSLASSLQKFARLEAIKLDGCQITASGLMALGSSCYSLKELSLSKCSGVTDEALSFVVTKHKGLMKLDITCCRKITDFSISCITSSCASLISLKMESCSLVSKEAFCLVGERCLLLEELDITDNDIDNQGLKAISNCHNLTILKMGLCLSVDDEGIVHIGKGCPKLEELDLYRSIGITDTAIMAIAQGCPMLKSINLAYCTEVTDNALRSLSKCSKLNTLEIRGCSQISDCGLATIAEGCREIAKLDLKKCYDISDIGMVPLAHLCCSLRQLNLSYSSVTDVGLLALANTSCLQSLTILHLTGLMPKGLAVALLACGGLRKVKLNMSLKYQISQQLIIYLESRGCLFQWRDKPFQAEVDANEVWKQRSQDLVAVV